eukprot:Plantae.Rhodophyta-Hildenbrandia_rubra.ctg14442.p1 GENE.Plantae.Rhodophyta-Hildenbrandia_rubra.ctg14442~~Plantae.Rhodophyta-Hildenbrandia_rubra.ctg14442.p1  ORF type:complete len:228 (+),score=17.09 Plantae.Rhodophyta-Hildenbrandia_rubra.ctg14442:396-1079(+)
MITLSSTPSTQGSPGSPNSTKNFFKLLDIFNIIMVATTLRAFFALSVIALLAVCKAQVPTPDDLIAVFTEPQAQRAALNNTLFFDPNVLPVANLPGGVTIQSGNVGNTLALAVADVNFAFSQATVPPNTDFPTHHHPGATEFQLNIEGKFRNTIFQEGAALEPIVFETKPGQFTAFPQGLPHTTTCISRTPCKFIGTFNGPAPGTVFVTPGLPDASPENTGVPSQEF